MTNSQSLAGQALFALNARPQLALSRLPGHYKLRSKRSLNRYACLVCIAQFRPALTLAFGSVRYCWLYMPELLWDIALSFCPAAARSTYRPHSTQRVLQAATLTGILQTVVCAWLLFSGYRALLALRLAKYGNVLERGNETTQAWFLVVFFIEYVLFHPFALLLLYLALEGSVRFVSGVCLSEVVPSLPVVLAFKATALIRRNQTQRKLAPLAAIPDAYEVLADGKHLRIASALAKATWTANLTIGIHGEWYEVEREETGAPPRVYVYVLRRAPIGKILRGYEEYFPETPSGSEGPL
jgi:hypothetical protein